MTVTEDVQVAIRGMDCVDCTRHVERAIARLPGVDSVEVYLAAEKAVIRLDPSQVGLSEIRAAVAEAGYSAATEEEARSTNDFGRPLLTLMALVFGAVLFAVVVGEWMGLFEAVTDRLPGPIGLAIVLILGSPIFRNVLRAAWRRQITAHTLMSVGAFAALAVGQWATAAVVVFFMHVGNYTERFTAGRARRAVKDLTALAPRRAHLERAGEEVEVPLDAVHVGDIVVVRPGEAIPVDGEVISGQATLNQATITGESMPVEAGPGTSVYAATFATLGSLRVRATHIGGDSTFGRVIKLVEEAEANRAGVQRLADKFSGYYLPLVAGIAALTYLIRGDALATAAVLVVACSCAFALATPIAMLASTGSAARRGLLIKGGKYLELLARADVLLIDKTGTLTMGTPEITDILIDDSRFATADFQSPDEGGPGVYKQQSEILNLAASAERYSEHPLAEAVRQAARERRLLLSEPHGFEAIPGVGIRARINGSAVAVGSRRMLLQAGAGSEQLAAVNGDSAAEKALEAQGKSLLYVVVDGRLAGALAAADRLRPEVPQAIQSLRELGVNHIELLTGDNPGAAADLAGRLGVSYRASLLPEDKIAIVKEYQANGHRVVMVGDGVNDAPALAQADVGIAMGAAGSGVAIEAAHISLMKDDWSLVPQVFQIARRTMRVVKGNIAFTGLYNLAGISLAAMGILPPVLAAAAQSLPDLGILWNSSRLLRQK